MKRDGEIDIISKAVYTPCNSRIKIGNFICPTWQLEGEKILHDNENLFLYQKHSKTSPQILSEVAKENCH